MKMLININRIVLLIGLFVFPLAVAMAVNINDPIPLLQGDLPNIGKTANMVTYIKQGYFLSIAIGAGMAFVMITYGGIIYATADALQNKQNGRKYIEDAVIGLVILIGSYAILNTINPELVNLNIGIDKPKVGIPDAPAVVEGVAACSGCTLIGAGGFNLPLGPGAPKNSSINTALGQKLLNLDASLRSINKAWQITAGYEPGGIHKDDCHNLYGTCVDAYPLDRDDVDSLKIFYNAAKNAGLTSVVYEVNDCNTLNIIKYGCGGSSCTVAPSNCPAGGKKLGNVDWVKFNGGASGEHFHMY